MKLKSEIFGGELTSLIDNYRRLVGERNDARETLDAAEQELKDAKDAGMVATVSAKLAGESVSESSRVASAEVALRTAQYDFDATKSAVLAALDRMVEEAQDPRYEGTLKKADDALAAKALKSLAALEATLEEMAEVRGHIKWTKQPTKGTNPLEVIVQDVWIEAESARKPNGDPAASKDLTKALREALQGEKPARTQQEWGIPTGAVMAGPWGVAAPLNSGNKAAADLFAELASGDIEMVKAEDGPPPAPTE